MVFPSAVLRLKFGASDEQEPNRSVIAVPQQMSTRHFGILIFDSSAGFPTPPADWCDADPGRRARDSRKEFYG
jgi:hypothetical protein